MNSDGTGLEQLTSSAGYDGGTFFNSHGDQICWRRFSPNGHKAEIYRMNLDSRKEKKLTNLLDNILSLKLLKSNGIIIIHRHKKEEEIYPKKFKILKIKTYGISKIIFGN